MTELKQALVDPGRHRLSAEPDQGGRELTALDELREKLTGAYYWGRHRVEVSA